MPSMQMQPISPFPLIAPDLLSIKPETTIEIALLAALREAEIRNKELHNRVLAYCEETAKLKSAGKLVGDRLPKLLSGDEFYEEVVKFTHWQREKAAAKTQRDEGRTEPKTGVEKWEKQEVVRKAENQEQRDQYHRELSKWKEAKAAAKTNKVSFIDPQPKLRKLTSAMKKPTLKDFAIEEIEKEPEGEEFDFTGIESNKESSKEVNSSNDEDDTSNVSCD
ncbi:hypothetical protein BDQ12DRAFT_720383 [Crucibulum laeve]|uniref:Uncharacterized protein n=1 Tax=Crucibulum laeve TaxID=68775 RepID=A0A5C3MK77_9AGAR|nr:hypothetical protein BDQ12DRAFT_720383 [Crucibulum laeve]